MTFLAFFIGCLLGSVVMAVFTLRGSMKSWEEGYDAAKNTFSDWGKGFDKGFECGCKEVLRIVEDDLK